MRQAESWEMPFWNGLRFDDKCFRLEPKGVRLMIIPMSKGSDLLAAALQELLKETRQELGKDTNGRDITLLTPEELSERLKVPLTWIYEQSRLGKIPTHKLGRYIRFDLHEVLARQKKD